MQDFQHQQYVVVTHNLHLHHALHGGCQVRLDVGRTPGRGLGVSKFEYRVGRGIDFGFGPSNLVTSDNTKLEEFEAKL